MRVREKSGGISVQGIGGTYVVLLGINCDDKRRDGLLGFRIFRKDLTENEAYYLSGFKTFEKLMPNPAPNTIVSTRDHPAQTFLWGDYTAKPNHKYAYTVTAMYGKPEKLEEGPAVEVQVSTESEESERHSIYFNRGVIGSQAFENKFGDIDLRADDDHSKNPLAWHWLSRGSEEAILAFIAKANGRKFGLRAAVYEFTYLPVLEAFKAADKSGADVEIICHLRDDSTGKGNTRAIADAGIKKIVTPRTKPGIAHNKFIVLLVDGIPTEVWTGSTNVTDNGIFGQSNVGHAVRDPDLAAEYLKFWERLKDDPTVAETRVGNMEATPDPDGAPGPESLTPIFSSRARKSTKEDGSRILEWYGEQISNAQSLVCFTAAFGVTGVLQDVLAKKSDILRMLLLEKSDKVLSLIKGDHELAMAVGATLEDTVAERMLKESVNMLATNVKYIHNKFLLIDPLGDHPLVVTGSANFSPNSVENNDENMLIIQDNPQVADVYLGEFMRMFTHFWARDFLNKRDEGKDPGRGRSLYLTPDDSWTVPYFKKGSKKFAERICFA